jgi:hypothetical protein
MSVFVPNLSLIKFSISTQSDENIIKAEQKCVQSK